MIWYLAEPPNIKSHVLSSCLSCTEARGRVWDTAPSWIHGKKGNDFRGPRLPAKRASLLSTRAASRHMHTMLPNQTHQHLEIYTTSPATHEVMQETQDTVSLCPSHHVLCTGALKGRSRTFQEMRRLLKLILRCACFLMCLSPHTWEGLSAHTQVEFMLRGLLHVLLR